MACMPMLSRLLLIVYGGIGDIIPMVGGAITTIPIITVGIMEAAIGVAAMAGKVEVFIPIAVIRAREAPVRCTEAMAAGVREPMAGRTGAMRKVLHVA